MPSDETPWWHEGSGPDPDDQGRPSGGAEPSDAEPSASAGDDPMAFAVDAAAQAARAAEALLRQARVAGWQESVAGGLGLLGAFMRAAADGGREGSATSVSVDRVDDEVVVVMDVVDVEVVDEPADESFGGDVDAHAEADPVAAAAQDAAAEAPAERTDDGAAAREPDAADGEVPGNLGTGADEPEDVAAVLASEATQAEPGAGAADADLAAEADAGVRADGAARERRQGFDPLAAFEAWLGDDDHPRGEAWQPSSLPPELAAWAQLGANVLATGLAGTRDHLRTGECRSCPICRGLALVRESNPDFVDGIGDALDVIVSMLSSPDDEGWPRR